MVVNTVEVQVLSTAFYIAPLAQLDRALDYESKGREFESLRVHHFFREVAQLGRALGLGPRGRRFESCLPDHLFFWSLKTER